MLYILIQKPNILPVTLNYKIENFTYLGNEFTQVFISYLNKPLGLFPLVDSLHLLLIMKQHITHIKILTLYFFCDPGINIQTDSHSLFASRWCDILKYNRPKDVACSHFNTL